MQARRSRHVGEVLHLRHVEQGHIRAYFKTVDNDVVVLAINVFQKLGLSELWVGFGSGKI